MAVSRTASETKETALVGGLLPATTYDIRMIAINNIDHSYFTEPVVVKTQEEGTFHTKFRRF